MSATSAQGLRGATEAMRAAARLEGIEPEGPLGIWMAAQDTILTALADFADRQEHLTTDILREFKSAAEAELAKQRVITYRAELALEAAQNARMTAEADKAKVAGEMIRDVSPKIIEGIRTAVVIREQRHNRGVELKRAATVGSVMIGLVIGGYFWRFAQDWTAVEQLSQTKAAMQHCLDTSPYSDDRKRHLCVIDDFIPRG